VIYATFAIPLGASGGGGLLGVYKTTDGGSNWTLTANSPNFLGTQGWYDNVTGVDPTDPNTVYVGGPRFYKSTDGGVNWTDIFGTMHVDFHALSFHNGAIYTGNDGGVYKSTDDGSTWSDLGSNGLVTHQFYKMGTAFDNANNLMGGAQDNGLNQYTGSTAWTKRRGGDGMEVVYDYTNSMIVYGENQNGARLRSTNGGASWSSINTGAPSGPWVTPLEMDSSVPTTLYTIGNTSGGNSDLYRTTNSGSNWSLLFNADETLDKDIKVAPSNNQVIYVLGRSALYSSSNGGSTFTKGSGLPTSLMNYVAVDPTNAQIAYIARSSFSTTSGQVFKTTDGGANWTNVTNGLPSIPAVTVAVDPLYPSNVYAGNDLGVYLSTDGGASWSDWSDNLPNVVIDELEIHAASRLIRAATHGRGMWEAPLFEPAGPLVANAGSDASICFGGSANLNGTATGGSGSYTFAWTVQSGPNTSNAQFNDATLEDPVFTPTLAGVYVLRFTVDDGVVAPVFDEVQITVNALPTATVNGDAEICAGSSTTLTAALTGTAPWSVTWSDGVTQSAVAASPATRSVSPATTTTYTVTSVTSNGCSNTGTGSATITVNPVPVANAGADQNVNSGQPVQIGGSPTASGGTPGYTYSWTPTAGLDDPTASNPTATVTSTTPYTVEVSDSKGCIATDQMTVFVGSANLALNKAVTASSSKTGYPPGNAVDGNVSTHWRSGTLSSTTNAWLRVDLGATYTIGSVVINWSGTFYAKNYKVQVSLTGSSWQTVYTDNAGNGGIDNVTFVAVSARYVRVHMTKHNEQVERINEFEVYVASVALAKESEGASEQSPVADYQLAQNYPNPFNPETVIRFALPEAGHVTVTVYSLTGQVVKQLADSRFASGRHQLLWDGRDASGAGVAGGVYFYRLTARGANGEVKFAQTRKMAFVK